MNLEACTVFVEYYGSVMILFICTLKLFVLRIDKVRAEVEKCLSALHVRMAKALLLLLGFWVCFFFPKAW